MLVGPPARLNRAAPPREFGVVSPATVLLLPTSELLDPAFELPAELRPLSPKPGRTLRLLNSLRGIAKRSSKVTLAVINFNLLTRPCGFRSRGDLFTGCC
jgi:hypothetical protein